MEKIFKNTGSDFAAYHNACKWLEQNGFSDGTMCGDRPIGIVKGDCYIAKWRNLTSEERNMCHGTMTSKDFRNGDVVIEIKDEYIDATVFSLEELAPEESAHEK